MQLPNQSCIISRTKNEERECIDTENLGTQLLEELNCETAFTIPIFGGIPISESVVVTWIIMAVVTLLCICLVRNLSVERVSKKQLILETAVGGMNHFFEEIC